MAKKKAQVKASSTVPRRVTVAGTEAKVRNVNDAFAEAYRSQAETLTEIDGVIESYVTLRGNLAALGKPKKARKGGRQ